MIEDAELDGPPGRLMQVFHERQGRLAQPTMTVDDAPKFEQPQSEPVPALCPFQQIVLDELGGQPVGRRLGQSRSAGQLGQRNVAILWLEGVKQRDDTAHQGGPLWMR